MIKRITTVIAFLFLIFLSQKQSYATHIMGADLYYKCLGGNTYEFTLTVYRDCSGTTLINSFSINVRSATCGITNKSVTVTLVGSPQEVSPLCPAQINNSSCRGGSLPGVQRNIYRGTTTLPMDCPDYVFYWEACCRNAALQNTLIYNANNTGMRIVATYNKLAAPCDNSPQFTALPVPYICMGQLINYNQGGYDSDGDSLVYNLVNALDDATSSLDQSGPIKYQPPWSATYPLTTPTGTVGFDSTTGQITMFPSAQMFTVMALRIDEYRKGVLIGSTMRDIQVVVLNCDNISPVISSDQFENLQGGNQTQFNRVEVCPGSTLSFDARFADPDHNNITLSSNVKTVLNGSSFTPTLFKSDSGKINITWTPTPLDTGTFVITVTVNDDACPVYGQSVYSYLIVVPKSTYAGPDLPLCQPNPFVQLNVTGGAKFTWSPAIGLSSTTVKSPQASPTVTTTYYVESDLSSLCRNKDTVVVIVVPPLNVHATVTPDTICSGKEIQLSGMISGGTGSSQVTTWTSIPSGFSASQLNTSDTPSSTRTYFLTVSDNACLRKDSAKVVVMPTPNSNFSLGPTNICQVDGHANAAYNLPPAGLTFKWTWNGATIVSGSSVGPYDVYWNNAGAKTVQLTVTNSNKCSSVTTQTVTVNKKPNVSFTASPVTGCEPLEVVFKSTSTNGDSLYQWTFGDGMNSSLENPTHSYTNGTYTVKLISESHYGCKDTSEVLQMIHVDPTPDSDFKLDSTGLCQFEGHTGAVYNLNSAGLTLDWTWNGATVVSGTGAGPYDVYWKTAGNKTVQLKVTNSFNCTSTTSKTLTVYEKPTASFTGNPIAGCEPLTENFINNSSGSNLTYLWNFGDSQTSIEKEPEHVYYKGNYDVTLIVKTSRGCKDTSIQKDMIKVILQPTALFTTDAKSGNEYDLSQAKFNFTNQSSEATHYKWFFGDGESSTDENPTHKYETVGTYEIMLVAYNDYCTDTFRFSYVDVVSYDNIFFPGAFSPNGDNKNELFHQLTAKGVVELSFKVYNRWGQIVFETDKTDGAWNGRMKNTGEPQDVGVYTYYAIAVMINSSTVEKKGNLTLLR